LLHHTFNRHLAYADDAIVLFLREKSAATINEIADKVGISRRTVLHKMNELLNFTPAVTNQRKFGVLVQANQDTGRF